MGNLTRREAEEHTKYAEEVGFEPTVPYSTTVFKTAAFDHSATPPIDKSRHQERRAYLRTGVSRVIRKYRQFLSIEKGKQLRFPFYS